MSLTEVLARIAIGVVLGATCKLICDTIEKRLLAKRGLEYKETKVQRIMLYIVMILLSVAVCLRFIEVTGIAYAIFILMACELVAVVDLKHRRIPNSVLLAMLVVRIMFGSLKMVGMISTPEFDILHAFGGLIVGFVVFAVPGLFGKSVGAGDVKFASCIGFCIGIMGLLYTVILMGMCILAYTIFQTNKALREMIYEIIPMGPFLALSMMVVMIYMG